ncbi:pyruvate kinase [Clostridium sp. MCC353]|uniref:PEP/pyruvate-binding domain-containing protein n=1 Tax=Clostridium sp. MCC353 TaxID=2592646 RepID=UPI001C010EE0|nr:PEP/pyruvate-binding domain-containing protein [Clostridium sp. MCC353]MBT9778167.1 pyruvate kinase [Clostridium sp. MCC353]
MTEYPDIFKKENLTKEERKCICNQIMTTEIHMEQLILKHFTDEDFRKVWKYKIGGGVIGGKACGLLMARKLIELNLPEYAGYLEPHNSYFVGTDVFYRYLVLNRCSELKAKHRLLKEHFQETEELTNRLRNGVLPDDIREKLGEMLDRLSASPIIVRSSSIMEDGYGNAFSGKYESIFCMNQGSREERLEELEDAIRRVYASVMNEQAIEYRRKRRLLDVDEQMALLIQPVAGQVYDHFYFPVASGMGCSYNPYKWMEYLNPEAGMLRMVSGLGTRAVERTPGDYPRLICLDRAQASLRTTMAERHKFSQRQVDVLDLESKKLCTKPLEQIISLLPAWQKKMILSHDTEAEELLAERRVYRNVLFADCQGLVNNLDFVHMMRDLMKMLETAYERPVDIEFAVTSPAEGVWKLNLLQCRPLQAVQSGQVHIPEGVDGEFLFDIRRTSMRRSKEERIDYIVWVDPQHYYEYPYSKKPDVARLIGRINQHFEDTDYKLMLLVPGRIGTSSPELGVPVTYSEISQFNSLCEVAYDKAGYHPDLSYGSHMFQDMVEADVYYGAINDNSKTRLYQPQLLKQYPEVLGELCPAQPELAEIIKVYDVSGQNASLILDSKEGRAVCRIKGA